MLFNLEGEGEGGRGGKGEAAPLPPLDLLSQTNQVFGWICFLQTQLFWL